MFLPHKFLYPCVVLFIFNAQSCYSELVLTPSLVLYSPGEPEYMDVLVRRVNDSLTLVCELKGDVTQRHYVWNYVPSNQSLLGVARESPLQITSPGPGFSSTLKRSGLQVADSGHYMCSVPPFSAIKYIAVQRQNKSNLIGPDMVVFDYMLLNVKHGCGLRWSMLSYKEPVYSLFEDPKKLKKLRTVMLGSPSLMKCSHRSGVKCARSAFSCGERCVLPTYVCDGRSDCVRGEDESVHMCSARVCSRPDKLNCSSGRCISASACCRGATPLCQQPDCCNEYTPTHLDGGGLLEPEFPPLYEDRRAPDDYGFIQSTIYTVTACALIFMIAVVLLVSAICKMQMKRAALRGYTHADRAARHHYSVQYHQAHTFPPCYEASRLLEQDGITVSPSRSPTHVPTDHDIQCEVAPEPAVVAPPRGLARLSALFSSRYRQVPTHPDVEMTSVPASSTPSTPSHAPLPLDYRSPTFCDLNTELIFTPEEMGRELNYMATPVEFFRRRTMRRNTLERVMDQLDRQRLTLQLGRFQLSIPRLGRTEPRPDTPVAEPRATLHSLRIDARDTYTLNGRTIRLLGADIQHTVGNPPSYTEAVRYKLYGPPPEYLSREGLNRQSTDVDQEATNNVEMPPRYDDLGSDVNGNNGGAGANNSEIGGNNISSGNSGRVGGNICEIRGIGDISGSIEASGNNCGVSGNSDSFNGNNSSDNGNSDSINGNGMTITTSAVTVSDNVNGNLSINVIVPNSNMETSNIETLSSIIDNLPAIDSDVNANDAETGVNNDHVIRDVVNVN